MIIFVERIFDLAQAASVIVKCQACQGIIRIKKVANATRLVEWSTCSGCARK